MKKYFVLLSAVLIGLLVGPGYWWWCLNQTGDTHGVYEVYTPAQDDWLATIEDLTPAMNDLVFTITASYSHEVPLLNDRETGFRATFKKDKKILWEENFELEAEKDKKQGFGAVDGGRNHLEEEILLKRDRIDGPGIYHFSLDKVGREELEVKRVVLEIKKNVIVANMKVVGAGIGLAVLGLVIMAFMVSRAVKRPKTAAAEQGIS